VESEGSHTAGLNSLNDSKRGVDNVNKDIENIDKRIKGTEDVNQEIQQLCFLFSRTRLCDDPTDAINGRQAMANIKHCAQYAHKTISVVSEGIDGRSTTSKSTLASDARDLLLDESERLVNHWLSTSDSVSELVTNVETGTEEFDVFSRQPNPSPVLAKEAASAPIIHHDPTLQRCKCTQWVQTAGRRDSIPVAATTISEPPTGPSFRNPREKPPTLESPGQRETPETRIEIMLQIALEDFEKAKYEKARQAFTKALRECLQNYPQGFVWDSSLIVMMARSYAKVPRSTSVNLAKEIILHQDVRGVKPMILALLRAFFVEKRLEDLWSLLILDFDNDLKVGTMKLLAIEYNVVQKWDKLIELLLRLLEIGMEKKNGTDDVFHSLAYAHYQKKDYDLALTCCIQAIEERERINGDERRDGLDGFLLHHSKYLKTMILMARGETLEGRVFVARIPSDIRQGMYPRFVSHSRL
jgi:tetratricopeptide (TPR) repeat protein